MADIAALNRDALRGQERIGLTLVLTYAPAAAARVRDMVRREQACCAFLDFDIAEHDDAVRVRVTAPAEARVAAETLFADFAAGGLATACACCQ
ncbi:MAG: hypothetical protein R3C25_14795 [Hyphomonadaceae bacterium]